MNCFSTYSCFHLSLKSSYFMCSRKWIWLVKLAVWCSRWRDARRVKWTVVTALRCVPSQSSAFCLNIHTKWTPFFCLKVSSQFFILSLVVEWEEKRKNVHNLYSSTLLSQLVCWESVGGGKNRPNRHVTFLSQCGLLIWFDHHHHFYILEKPKTIGGSKLLLSTWHGSWSLILIVDGEALTITEVSMYKMDD